MLRRMSFPVVLIVGDVVCVLLSTLAGFAFHRELSASALARFTGTFLPFAAAWLFASWLAGAYAGDPHQGWRRTGRALGAAALAAPLAAVLRGAWLRTAVLPIFVVVMGLAAGGLILVWRLTAEWLLPAWRNAKEPGE